MIENEARELLQIVSDISKQSIQQIKSASRRSPLPVCRYLVFYELRLRGYTTFEIGKQLNRDHASVLHGCKMVQFGLKHAGFNKTECDIEQAFLTALEDRGLV